MSRQGGRKNQKKSQKGFVAFRVFCGQQEIVVPPPPILPDLVLQRVIRVARRDGLTVVVIAGGFAILSAMAGSAIGAAVGIVITGAGVFELHGVSSLRAHRATGMSWLIGSQVYLMFAVLAYCIWRLDSFDVVAARELIEGSAQLRSLVHDNGQSVTQFIETLRKTYIACYMLVALLTVLYQGAMALYYLRRRKPVAAALGADLDPNT